MSSPENLSEGGWEKFETAEAWSIRNLFLEEFKDLNKVFDTLRGELERVELLGIDDSTRRSYHQGPNSEGGEIRLYYQNRIDKGVGRFSRILVNYETSLINDGRLIELYDFAFARERDAISLNYDEVERGHHQSSLNRANEIAAPYIYLRDGKVRRTGSPNYRFAEPFNESLKGYSHIDVFDHVQEHIDRAELLTEFLSLLSPGTREDNIQW